MRNCFSGNFSKKQFPLFSYFWVNKNGSWVMTYNQDESQVANTMYRKSRTHFEHIDLDAHQGYWLKNGADRTSRHDAQQTIAEGQAITRVFSSGNIQMHQHIRASTHTYLGTLRSLYAIKKLAKSEGISMPCVLCERYAAAADGRWAADTQVGGSGKCAGTESRIQSASEEIAEEFRLRLPAAKLTSLTVTKQKQQKNVKVTEVFAARVAECSPIEEFDAELYGAKNRRGRDDKFQRAAFFLWGCLDECLDVLAAMEVASASAPLVDGIDAISIVSLDKAIEMVQFAIKAYKAKSLAHAVVSIRARVKFWDSAKGFGYAAPEDKTQTKCGVDVLLPLEHVQEAGLCKLLQKGDVLELTVNPAHDKPKALPPGLRRVWPSA
jgi:cold shock CspA family protein